MHGVFIACIQIESKKDLLVVGIIPKTKLALFPSFPPVFIFVRPFIQNWMGDLVLKVLYVFIPLLSNQVKL